MWCKSAKIYQSRHVPDDPYDTRKNTFAKRASPLYGYGMDFQEWLNQQTEREDAIGKLAQAMTVIDLRHLQSRSSRSDEHKKWANIVTLYGEIEHVRAFNTAWSEYEALNGDEESAAP